MESGIARPSTEQQQMGQAQGKGDPRSRQKNLWVWRRAVASREQGATQWSRVLYRVGEQAPNLWMRSAAGGLSRVAPSAPNLHCVM